MSARWKPAVERFRARITEVPSRLGSSCWQWDTVRPATGYGDFYDGKAWLAHRWSYVHFKGEIDEGLQIDHLCRNRGCVNPEHLEAVSPRENTMRGESPAAQSARSDTCPNGHPYTPENTYRRGKWRRCRTCTLASNAKTGRRIA